MQSSIKQVDWLEEVESTNDYLKQFVERGRPRAVVADLQSAGKGRGKGRVWYSPRGEGLYASFLIYPDWPVKRADILNVLGVLAVIRSIRALSGVPESRGELGVKPPNDVLLNARKVAGVLVEMASQEDTIRWAVVGLGVNLFQTEFPAHSYRVAPTSLALEAIDAVSVKHFFLRIKNHFEELIRQAAPGGLRRIEQEFQQSVITRADSIEQTI